MEDMGTPRTAAAETTTNSLSPMEMALLRKERTVGSKRS